MMSNIKLTILTDPVGSFGSNIRLWIKLNILHRRWCGHPAVTRSLVEGLNKIGYTKYNLNPYLEKDIAGHVHVLAGVKTLEYAIELKRKGKINKLTAGPNVVNFSDDYDSIIASPEVDLFLQPSDWSAKAHVIWAPSLSGRIDSWPAGVDLSKYPLSNKVRNIVLIYHKEESLQFCKRVEYLIKKMGYSTRIITYGKYKFNDFIDLLGQTIFCVMISRQESQGLCLAECWSQNVPTFCFEPHYYYWEQYDRELFGDNVSTAPYLSEFTGAFWENLSDLEELIIKYKNNYFNFSPRKWVEENMTDEVIANDFLKKVGEI